MCSIVLPKIVELDPIANEPENFPLPTTSKDSAGDDVPIPIRLLAFKFVGKFTFLFSSTEYIFLFPAGYPPQS